MTSYYGVIYVITNSVNGKQYVGQTTKENPSERWKAHLGYFTRTIKYRSPLYSALKKYGVENFSFKIVKKLKSKALLDAAEDAFILELKTLAPLGYNLRRGGANGKYSDEGKAQIRERMNHPDMVEKTSSSVKLAWAKPEVRDRYLKGLKKYLLKRSKSDPDYMLRLRAASLQPEALAKRSMSLKIAFAKPDVKDKRSKAQKIAQNKPEVKAASSARLNGPASMVKRREASLKPEVRAKLATGKDTLWITNGIENARLKSNSQLPDGWTYGLRDNPEKRQSRMLRAKLLGVGAVGSRWINNGVKNARLKKSQSLPNGWSYGRMVHADSL